jgi:hypothetical protein
MRAAGVAGEDFASGIKRGAGGASAAAYAGNANSTTSMLAHAREKFAAQK